MQLFQDRAITIAREGSVTSFKASRAQRYSFVYQTTCKGGSIFSVGPLAWMSEIIEIAKDYELNNIYNQYESGLIYHLCQNH